MMQKSKSALRALPFLFAVSVACICKAPVTPEPEIVIYRTDAGKTPCERACSRLRSLGCPEGDEVDGGDTCAQVCERGMRSFDLAPECVIQAKNRQDVRSCGPIRCFK